MLYLGGVPFTTKVGTMYVALPIHTGGGLLVLVNVVEHLQRAVMKHQISVKCNVIQMGKWMVP